MGIKNKKGSHVEVIISFVLFITFLVAMYTIMKPAITNPIEQQYLLNHVEEMIKKETSTSLTIMTITGDNSPCLELEAIDIEDYKIYVKDESGADADICITDDEEGYAITPIGGSTGEIKIYHSNQFPIRPMGYCSKTCKQKYDLEKQTTEYIVKTNITNLQSRSTGENYGVLKEKFGVPDGKDFEFNFKESNLYVTSVEDKGVNVYAKEVPVLYVDDETGEIKTGFLNVKVW